MKLIKEYDFTNMTTLEDTDWNIQVGEKWQNNEQQQYVSDKENIFFDDGLHIKATIKNGIIKSGRINTRNNFSFLYGRIDIIAKVPKGVGTWPALWMMPQHSPYGYWPRSGEIDIMEHAGQNLNELFLCLHTEKYNHRDNPNVEEQYYTKVYVEDLTDTFYTYSLDWTEDTITYLLNDQVVATYTRGQDGRDATEKGWPFDNPYYLIINLAIGGTFGGKVDMSMFPQEFIIKNIKVYQK